MKQSGISYILKLNVKFLFVIYLFVVKEVNLVFLLTLSFISFIFLNVMKKEARNAYLFLLPSVVLSLVFSIYPSLSAIIQSFLTVSNSGKIMGFAFFNNYKILFSDPSFLNALKNTIVFVLLFVPLNTFLTLLCASLTRRKSRFSRIPEFIFFMPLAVSLSAYSLTMKELFRGRSSVINNILSSSFAGITTPMGAMIVLVILGIFLDFGLDYILLLCSFRSIDKSIIEAARMDGAGGERLFFMIELPQVKHTVLVTVFLAIKDAVLISAPVIILTEGGPYRSTETLMFYYYTEAFRSGNRAVQNTLSSLVLYAVVIFMVIYHGRKKNED